MVSVIIPTYNRASTIERAVRSVLNQSYTDIECIVVDDGSDDDTREIVETIDDRRLRYFCLEHNCGACTARNKGIELALGEYIAFQDSDDKWAPQKLKVQLDALQQSMADICFCRKRMHNIKLNSSEVSNINLNQGFVAYENLYKNSQISTQTILAHKYVFNDFKFDIQVAKGQDYEWTLRAGERYSIYFIEEVLVDQYMQEDSITVNGEKDYLMEKEVCQYIFRKFQNKYETNPGLEIALLDRLAQFKVLSGENAASEYKKLFKLTKESKNFLKFMAEKTGTKILRRIYLRRRKDYRSIATK